MVNQLFAFANNLLQGLNHLISAQCEIETHFIMVQQSFAGKVDLAIVFG